MDVGTALRTARELRGIPLSRMAATTKIPVTVLRALEANDFDRVPAGIFVRGYIRAYAREVGLEPEAAVAQFLAETGHAPPTFGMPEEPPVDDSLEPLDTDPDLDEPSRASWGYVLIVAALLIGFISVNRSGEPEAPEAAVDRAPVAEPAPAGGVQPVLATVEERAVPTTGSRLRIELQAQGLCWVRAVADGTTIVERLLQPGDREVFEADRDVVLRVGDPGALLHSVNGTPGDPLGRPGMPVTVRFTNEGHQFLAS